MATVKNYKENDPTFDCITQEAERQRIKHPEHVDAIDAAEKKTRSLVTDGKLAENLMLVEFTRAVQKLWASRISPRIRYASE